MMNSVNEILETGRICVLHHVVGASLPRTDQDHFDWLIEGTTKLFTWSIDENTMRQTGWLPGTRPIPTDWIQAKAMRIADHRKFYLEHEGPVSQDRGQLTRVEQGRYQLRRWNRDNVELDVQWTDASIAEGGKSPTRSAQRDDPATSWGSVGASARLRLQRTRVDGSAGSDSMAWRLGLLGADAPGNDDDSGW